MSDDRKTVGPLLVSASQLVDGRGEAPVADAGVLVDATGMISWAGPMVQAGRPRHRGPDRGLELVSIQPAGE